MDVPSGVISVSKLGPQDSRAFSAFPGIMKLLSLTHTQLKIGTANQRHPFLTSKRIFSAHFKTTEKEHQWQNKEQ